MAVSIVNIGRAPGTPDPDFASEAAGDLVACCYTATSAHMWGVTFRGRFGRSGVSTPSVRMALYAKSGSAPSARLGHSGTVSASTAMVSWNDGAFYTSDVSLSDDGPTNTSIPIPSGTIPALAILGTSAGYTVGMKASDGTMSDPNFYERTSISQPPPDPYGSPSISVEGNLTLSLECHVNEPPLAPNFRVPSGTINDIVPELSADHRDLNGATGPGNGGYDDGDYMRQFQVQVRRVSDQVSFWTPSAFTATAPQQASNHFEVVYAGTTLVRGTAYEWRCRTSDHFSAWGDWSTWLAFTPANLGFVDLNGNPQSTVQDNTPDFEFDWTHQSSLSTNAVRMRLYQGSTLIYTSGIITDSTASGASGLITWAESALGTPYPNGLDWGQTWKYDIQGRDTGGQWSDYSDRRQFKTDAAPSIPDGLAPSNGEIVTSYPLLTFQLSDADDTVGTGLQGFARLFGANTLANADFEVATLTEWTCAASAGFTFTLIRDTAVKHAGAASGKLAITVNSNGAGSFLNIINNDAQPAVPGSTVGGSIWVYTTNTGLHPRVQIRFYDVANAFISSTAEADYVPGATSTWSQRFVTATVPLTATTYKIAVVAWVGVASATGTIQIDDTLVNDSYRFTREATYNGTTGLWEYQTDGTDLPTFDDYKWDAYGYDGTLYSGATTVLTSAVKSSEETFSYQDGPTATITSPTDGGTITSSTPTVTWISSSQNRYQLTFYETGTTNIVYRRGWVISGATSWAVPSGYLHNNAVYDVELIVEDNTPLQGYAPMITVTGAFTGPPSATGFAAVPVTVDDNDPWPTAIRLQWDATSEPGGTFVGYYIYRDDIGLTGTPYVKLASPDDTSWIDPVPASGREYTYALRVIGQRDLDRVSSARVYASATVNLGGVVLVDVNNPFTYRCVLDDVTSRDRTRVRDEQIFMVGAEREPITFRSPTSYWEETGEYRIIPPNGSADKVAAIAQRFAAVLQLEDQDPVVCARNERGDVTFGRIFDFSYSQLKFYPIVRLSIRSELYTLGVSIDQEFAE